MGNRAIITDKSGKIGVYLHWNGGRDSVEGFLEYCKRKGCRGFGSDSSYAMARLVQVVSNFFGGTTSVGITTYTEGCEDNGVYVVEDWDIVGRHYRKYNEETGEYEKADFPESWEQREYPLDEMLEGIDEKQPEREKLGDMLKATLVPVSSLQLGDVVYVDTYKGPQRFEIIGFGNDEVVNGSNVLGIPMINNCCGGSRKNPNNYIHTEEVWKV